VLVARPEVGLIIAAEPKGVTVLAKTCPKELICMVVFVIVVGSIGSLNMTTITVLGLTPVVRLEGWTSTTLGGVISCCTLIPVMKIYP
jgi:hypothetical protein